MKTGLQKTSFVPTGEEDFQLLKAVAHVGPAATGLASLSVWLMKNCWLFVFRHTTSVCCVSSRLYVDRSDFG